MTARTACRIARLAGILFAWGICAFAFPAGAALIATNLFPANGATNICPDTPLAITFDRAPGFLNTGQIRIFTAAGGLVDTIDLSTNDSAGAQVRLIAGTGYKTYPVMVTSNTARIYPHLGVLTTGQTYYVNITAGIFTNASVGTYAGIADSNTWRFTTKAALPPAGTNHVVVAGDGSGDFCTVQGAIDYLPASSATPRVIFLRNGLYREINRINSKHNLKFRGEHRKQTVISYSNNANFNSQRYMFVVGGNDITFENLTLTNSTAIGGSQAETLLVNGLRCTLNNVDIASFQDTIQCTGAGNQLYVHRSLVMGDTDFIWGSGTTMFFSSEIRAQRQGHNCVMRTIPMYYGAVFVDCVLTKSNGASFTSHNLGRLASSSSDPGTNGHVAYINCRMDTHISSVAWFNNGFPTENLRWWEYQSMNLAGTAFINTNGRAAYSRQLSTAEALPMRNPAIVFGTITGGVANSNGWLPQLAPYIISQPTNLTVVSGQTATFTVGATGIPDPTLQWRRGGTNIPGATNISLVISNAQSADATNYFVVVSNAIATVTSSVVTLSVNFSNSPPTFGTISNRIINAGFNLTIAGTGNDPDAPVQTLTYSLLQGPTNATVDATNGTFTWRPLVSQTGNSNHIILKVSDNGIPSLSATQSFGVTVNPLGVARVNPGSFGGGFFTLSVTGSASLDYAVQASTNLQDWETVHIANSATPPFNWIDTEVGIYPRRFYRLAVGPPLTGFMTGAHLYVATNGNDNAGGSYLTPLATLGKAVALAGPGDTVFVRGGTYYLTNRVRITTSGTVAQPITIRAFASELPLFDCFAQPFASTNRGIEITGSWWRLYGLEVAGAGQSGILVSGHSNVVEKCRARENRGSGIALADPGSYNLVLNCDSWRNYDPPTHGENADGFAAKFGIGPGNVFRGCRAWENSDDGWDLWMATNAVLVEDCWTWRNGSNYWNDPLFTGNGNGFKLGGSNQPGSHIIRRCISFANPHNGFDQNNNLASLALDQNTAWANTRNYNLDHGTNATPHVLRNNLSIATAATTSVDSFRPGTIYVSNSWDVVSPPATDSDVVSVDDSLALAPRADGGGLPATSFLRPVPAGRLVDQGANLGMPFTGAAPDLGALESQ